MPVFAKCDGQHQKKAIAAKGNQVVESPGDKISVMSVGHSPQLTTARRWNYSSKLETKVSSRSTSIEKSTKLKGTAQLGLMPEFTSDKNLNLNSDSRIRTMRARLFGLQACKKNLVAKQQEVNGEIEKGKSTLQTLKKSLINSKNVVSDLKLDAQLWDSTLDKLTKNKALREAQLTEKRAEISCLQQQLKDSKVQNQKLIAENADLGIQMKDIKSAFHINCEDQQRQKQQLLEAQAEIRHLKEQLDQLNCYVIEIKGICEKNILLNQELVDLQRRYADLQKNESHKWAECFQLCLTEILYAVVQHLLPMTPALLPIRLNVRLAGVFRKIFRADKYQKAFQRIQ